MASNITDLSFNETATLQVELVAAVDTYTRFDADTVIDIQDKGVMVDYASKRYFVPWSNVRAIKQAV